MTKNIKDSQVVARKKSRLTNQLSSFLNRFFYIFTFIFSIILIISGCLFVLRPKYEAIKADIAATYEAQKQDKDEMENYLINLKKYKKASDSISEEEKDKINMMIAEDPHYEDLFAQIESIISSQGLILVAINIIKDNSKAELNQSQQTELGVIEVELTVAGLDYNIFKNLLTVLENNLRIMDVKKLDFIVNEKIAKLVIAMYYLK